MNERLRKLLMMDYATKNQGKGLFGNVNQSGLFSNLSNINPNLLIGANIAGAGLKGQDPFSPIMPSVLQAAKIHQAFRGKRKLIKAKNKNTGENVFIDERIVAQNPNLYEPMVTKMFEDAETKALGTGYADEFRNLLKLQATAIDENEALNLMTEIVKLPDLKTGQFGALRQTIEKVGMEMGLELDFQNASAADVLSSISGKLVLAGLANFTGAISDKEREYLMDILPGMSTTQQGNEVLITIKRALNNRTSALADSASNWRATYGKLSAKNAEGQTWEQFKIQWYNDNPLVTDEMRKTISSLGNKVDEAFADNVKVIDSAFINEHGKQYEKYRGKTIMVVGGKIYEL